MQDVTTTSKASDNKIYVRSVYNPAGRDFKEVLTAAVKRLVSSGEFETVVKHNGKKDGNQLNIR